MNEKEKDIRLLLDRFMAGETSLEEEALLGEWFRQHPDVSDDLKEYQLMFGYFDEGMPLDYEAENHVEDAHPKTKARMRRLWLPIGMAASIALLFVIAIPRIGQQTGHRDDSKMAQLDGRTTHEDVDSAVVHEEKSTDANLSMPEKIKKSGDSVSPKTRKHKPGKYRQHKFTPAPPKLWIAQNIATDSLLAEPEKLADEHLIHDSLPHSRGASPHRNIQTSSDIPSSHRSDRDAYETTPLSEPPLPEKSHQP